MIKVTVSMPCYGRPERTKRAILSIVNQDFKGWEAIIQGDGCPHFQELINSGWLEEQKLVAECTGDNLLYYANTTENKGGCGYALTNAAIKGASGKYLVFMANDDLILPDHLSTYYNAIELAQKDFLYLDTWLHPHQQTRVPHLAPSMIGHSEIIVKTELAKKAPPHTNKYGHDWDFIEYISKHGKGAYFKPQYPTYHVMHIPNFGTKDVID